MVWPQNQISSQFPIGAHRSAPFTSKKVCGQEHILQVRRKQPKSFWVFKAVVYISSAQVQRMMHRSHCIVARHTIMVATGVSLLNDFHRFQLELKRRRRRRTTISRIDSARFCVVRCGFGCGVIRLFGGCWGGWWWLMLVVSRRLTCLARFVHRRGRCWWSDCKQSTKRFQRRRRRPKCGRWCVTLMYVRNTFRSTTNTTRRAEDI